MSNQYKLEKWYPSLPDWIEEGFIAHGSTDPNADEYGIAQFKTKPYRSHVLPAHEVENNPEFWKKLGSEAPYKIVSFRFKKTGAIKASWGFDEGFQGDAYWKIYGVRRKSDDEIFEIGDTVRHEEGAKFTIKNIRIYNGDLQLTSGTGVTALIDQIEHELPYLTHDDFEVQGDDLVYTIANSLNESHPGGNDPYYVYRDKARHCADNNYKFFKHKSNCIEYAESKCDKYTVMQIRNAARRAAPNKSTLEFWGHINTMISELTDPYSMQ